MREIKFRAWNTETNKMIINLKEMGVFALQSTYSIDEFLVIPTNEKYPLMQYTGLKDKSNKEIYEGDLLKVELDWGYGLAKIIVEIYFKDGCFRAKALNSHEDILLVELPYFKIIRNIYENSELLKAL